MPRPILLCSASLRLCERTVVLPPSAQGKPVQFRWRLGTDTSVSATGWRVDTVQRCGVIVPPILSIDTVGVTKEEGNSGVTNFEFTVTRRGKTDVESTMNYSVSGFTDNPANADDFNGTFPSGTVTFPINATTVTLSIPVRADILDESMEGFKVILSNPSGDALLDETEAIGSIVNDDVVDIVNRRVFYAGSSFQTSGGVHAATDTNKVIARANTQNQALTFQNLINTTLGINGVYLDLAGIIGSNITASDFVFRVSPTGAFSNSANPPSVWATAPNPYAFVLTPGTATTPVRARIEWANGAIFNRWLQIKVLANSRTSLPTPQVFYIGHLQGETNGLAGEIFSVELPPSTQASGADAATSNVWVAPVADAGSQASDSPLLSLDEYFKRLGRGPKWVFR